MNPWHDPQSYEAEVVADKRPYLWSGVRRLSALILVSWCVLVFGAYLLLR